jgi:ribosomal protein S6--L-glutamate ligase
MGEGMTLYFLLVRRVPPVPSPVLAEVFELLAGRGFVVDGGIAEELVGRADTVRPEHDLYVLKSHTELSLSLAGALHAQGARVLNPYPCCAATQNKIVATRRLRAAGVPVPRTWVTGDLALLRPIVRRTPLVVKPYLGHRGVGVHVIRTAAELRRIPVPDGAFVAQEYVEGDGEDVKLYVVGDEVFCVRKRFSPESFTVPGRPSPVSAELREIGRRAGRALGLGLYGLDVIESADGPVVVDTNYFPGYKGVPGAAASIASYIERYARGEIALELPAAEPGRKGTETPAGRGAPRVEVGA